MMRKCYIIIQELRKSSCMAEQAQEETRLSFVPNFMWTRYLSQRGRGRRNGLGPSQSRNHSVRGHCNLPARLLPVAVIGQGCPGQGSSIASMLNLVGPVRNAGCRSDQFRTDRRFWHGLFRDNLHFPCVFMLSDLVLGGDGKHVPACICNAPLQGIRPGSRMRTLKGGGRVSRLIVKCVDSGRQPRSLHSRAFDQLRSLQIRRSHRVSWGVRHASIKNLKYQISCRAIERRLAPYYHQKAPRQEHMRHRGPTQSAHGCRTFGGCVLCDSLFACRLYKRGRQQ